MNKKRVVITGVAGYIGTELTKLYSRDTSCEVVGVDNRFIPERVAWMSEHGIKFIEKDLFSIRSILAEADVVIHLAGVTDVAYVSTQANPEQDALIRRIGIDGTMEVIRNTSDDCKIIFPSTHVIFEGLQKETLNIGEDFPPCPVLCYASVKRENEKQLLDSKKNVSILRLASVYGYNENMRTKIVGNLFAKMASQNTPIKLFGGGVNYKPCVGVRDVARLMKRCEESYFCRPVIYNVVNENLRVKEIADICKKYNSQLDVQVTDDEVPNAGYTLSNKKLLDSGFVFEQNIDKEIHNMIYLWRNHG
jgi:nucleoside-diphosphate-sugar epimerase